MSIFGLAMGVLGGVAALVADVVSVRQDGKQREKPTRKSQKPTGEEN